jgi:chorismate mutase
MHTIVSQPNDGAAERLLAARHAIDALDDELLALIEKRFALSLHVAGLKQQDDAHLRLRPRREAEIVARLTDRATSATPQLIAQVWRELMAHSLQAQVRTELVLHASADCAAELRDAVRARFGRAAPLVIAGSAQEALDRARDGQAVAIVELGDTGWWTALAGQAALTIFDTLQSGDCTALIVGKVAAADIAPGHEVSVLPLDEAAEADIIARHDSLCLGRYSGQRSAP